MATKYTCKIALLQKLGHVIMSMYWFKYQKRLFCNFKMILVSYFLNCWIKIEPVHVL